MNLDQAPFPFGDPLGAKLHVALCRIYPSSKAAALMFERAGGDAAFINPDQPPIYLWADILKELAPSGKVRQLVQLVTDDARAASYKPFLDSLLRGGSTVQPAEPVGKDGKPLFRVGDDSITDPESMLYHDDLTLSVGAIGGVILALEYLQSRAPAVCKLEVEFAGLGAATGTGLRIGPQSVLTNWHVIELQGVMASKIAATFGYEEDADGNPLNGTSLKAVHTPAAGDRKDDWAVLRVPGMSNNIPTIQLSASADATVGEPAFIIQHPSGSRKRVAYARNTVTLVNDRVIQYLADTNTGSSGAPVFNGEGRLIALHHAGGRPQVIAGGEPVCKNEGIRISRVKTGLEASGLTL